MGKRLKMLKRKSKGSGISGMGMMGSEKDKHKKKGIVGNMTRKMQMGCE